MNGEPTQEEQIAFFDRWTESNRKEGFAAIEPESRARGEAVLAMLDCLPLAEASILEVGCGSGWLTERLISYGATTGIDLSPRAIELARGRGLDARFLAGDFLTCDLPRGSSISWSASIRSPT